MRRPRSAGKLMKFLRAVNRTRASLRRLGEKVEPLRVLLEEHMAGNVQRTERTTLKMTIEDAAWVSARPQAWNKAQDLVAYPLTLSHPIKGYDVLMFPDALHLCCGGFVTDMPRDETDSE